ncbi:beta-lactamase family protein [Parvularcula flava]|uniref:Beta-lactamase family protein n=1 Tax=Aquisalinus luteolus TaxID=1566827 RepID=A0A8J3EPV3_9PROT|nr:serine hydrolase domain-containing protein [Aquisalinus luteolus]NHK26451.1 beta-lactamase family protein [Aquisalinus luteolus]GGH92373.1 FmtA-like protein [Aquisalinus luteolus]
MNMMRHAVAGIAAALVGFGLTTVLAQDPMVDPVSDLPAEAVMEDVLPAAQEPAPVSLDPGTGVLTKSDVDTWLDGFMPYALKDGGIVGAVVTVVADGEILTSRGFGYADIENGVKVDGDATLFRPGSVSKLFTWTAIMQLVEQGQVDLDEPVATYIDYDIPNDFDTPITVRHLLTHTAGFEEVVKNLILEDEEMFMSLEDYLKSAVPGVVFEPGTIPAYSNYATGLAGYIVERVSGLSFEAYVNENIFQPLGMESSTFAQPLPEEFQANMSVGYTNAADGTAQGYELIPAGPAGSLAASGSDMGRFMIAHLNEGGPLLQPETSRQMLETLDQKTPPLNAMALGFFEQNIRGLRSLGHAGDTMYFHSNLALFLDKDVGIYVSVNSSGEGASPIRLEVVNEFAMRYFPEARGELPPRLDTAAEHGAKVAGVYETSRAGITNFIALLRFQGQLTVALDADNDLTFPFMGGQAVWREVEPWVWQKEDSYERLSVRLDDDGNVEILAFEFISPFTVYTPVPAWKSSALLNPLIMLALGIILLTLLFWPVRAVVRWRYGSTFPLSGKEALSYRLVRLGTVFVVVWMVLWLWAFMTLTSDLTALSDSFTVQLRMAQLSQLLLYAGLAISLWNVATVWTSKSSWFARLWSVLLPVAFVIFIWFAAVNGMLTFRADF